MKILNSDSLVKTVENFNEAQFFGRDWADEAEDIVDWISNQLGKKGGYLGSFAMTESDWQREFRLFTGEKISSNAGRSHVIAEEANRILRVAQKEIGTDIEACDISEQRLSERIFRDPRSTAEIKGEYCCATCSVALWRCVNAGGFKGHEIVFQNGLATLSEHRKANGDWKRYPYYYTLLALWESNDPNSKSEITFQQNSCKRRRNFLRNRSDCILKRRFELLNRILKKQVHREEYR